VFWGRAFPEVMPNSRGLKLDLLQKYNSAGGRPRGVGFQSLHEAFSRSAGVSHRRASVQRGCIQCGPNDYLSIYRVIKQQGIVPKTIVLGLDPEVLDPANTPAPDFDSNLELSRH